MKRSALAIFPSRKYLNGVLAFCGIFSAISIAAQTAEVALPATPPQDQGLPYTRSAQKHALEKIRDGIAIYPGSRYAWANGFKVRLDETSWRAEAVMVNSVLYVPEAFVPIMSLTEIKPEPAPKYLAERWVYTVPRPEVKLPDTVGRKSIGGVNYVDAVAAAKSLGLSVASHPRGVVMFSKAPQTFEGIASESIDAVITMFDTPEKLADPDIATAYIPDCKRQGKWTDHVKVTPEQLAMLNGPEYEWPMVPESKYDYTGLNRSLLGSKPPKPGVYPRVLFSPDDIPEIARRIKASKTGHMGLLEMEYLFEKSWWDPKTPDGIVFQRLASGDLAGLEWDRAPGMPPANVPNAFKGYKIGWLSDILPSMAFYCLIMDDKIHGRQVASAIANYFKLREPLVDEWNAISDSEFGGEYTCPDGKKIVMGGGGSSTNWRGMHSVLPNMQVGLMLDFGGAWMTEEEKDVSRRVMAKATYGRRAYGQDGPKRFADVNWVSWDFPQFLALSSIEGLEGFDREAWESNCEYIKAFCNFGIDPNGVAYESNAKGPFGYQGLILSISALARRGENLWGHPHLRNFLQGQIMMTSPSGNVIVNSGSVYGGNSSAFLRLGVVDAIKAFYPDDRIADYFICMARKPTDNFYSKTANRIWLIDDFKPSEHKAQLAAAKGVRVETPGPSNTAQSVLYSADYVTTTRADLKLPLDFNAPVHGVFSAYSGSSSDAAWINMMVRPDHYLGGGHHHADSGMLHFSALGVDWFTELKFGFEYPGKYHSLVLVDGSSLPEKHEGAAKYLGASIAPGASFAAADLTYSYSWQWQTQPGQVWSEKEKSLPWELDPTDHIARYFAGTARYKMRPWWHTFNFGNYMPTSRAPWNPMQYVFRTVGLVRGGQSYGIVIDDLKKDDKLHLYQWVMMLNNGVWQAEVAGVPPGALVLGQSPENSKSDHTTIQPKAGDALLLVLPVSPSDAGDKVLPLMQVETQAGPPDKDKKPTQYERLVINHRGTEVGYKVLLLPFRMGDPLPAVTADPGGKKATVLYKDQKDELLFTTGADKRTRIAVIRNGTLTAELK